MKFQPFSSRIVQLLLCLGLTLVAPPTWSVEVDELYVSEVLVTEESDRQLKVGAQAGLVQVLVRVSGEADVESHGLVRAALRDPSDYYYQFSYETTDRTLIVEGEAVSAKLLRVHFEPSAVARLLRDAGYPVWGSNRPSVLVWIAVSEGANRRLLAEGDDSEIVQSLRDQAKQRGIPITFPIMDLVDNSQISTAEVWGAFLDRIGLASDRYAAEVVLTGRMQNEFGSRWTSRWSSRISEEWESRESEAYSSDELARELVNELANKLASRYALGSSQAKIRLVVEGVVGLPQYAAISRYLENLTPVLNSTVTRLQSDVAEFELQTEGQYEQLLEIIQLDERMILLNEDRSSKRLLYRWSE